MPLLEKDKLISDESKIANSSSNFFKGAIQSLGIKANEHSNESYGLNNTFGIAIKKFEQHPTTNLISENVINSVSVHFLQQNMTAFY